MKHLSELDIYGGLDKKTLGANSKNFDLRASRGWFESIKMMWNSQCA